MRLLAIAIIVAALVGAGAYVYNNQHHTSGRHCQYVGSKVTDPNSPWYGINRGSWVCKNY